MIDVNVVMEYNEENLLKLHAQGLTYLQMANVFGVTRSSVGGKLYRLGLKKAEPKKIVVKVAKPLKPNKHTFVFKAHTHKDMTKNELRDMLKQAVENTK